MLYMKNKEVETEIGGVQNHEKKKSAWVDINVTESKPNPQPNPTPTVESCDFSSGALVVSQYIGSGDQDNAEKSTSPLLMFSVLLSLLIGALVMIANRAMLGLLFGAYQIAANGVAQSVWSLAALMGAAMSQTFILVAAPLMLAAYFACTFSPMYLRIQQTVSRSFLSIKVSFKSDKKQKVSPTYLIRSRVNVV